MTAVKRHDLIGLLDTHMNQEEVDVLIKNNKQTFKDFYDPVLIPSLTRGIMVLLRKSSPFKMEKTEVVTQNCLAIKLKSASNQEIEVAFVYNPNDESDKISNLRKALDHLADNGAKNQMIIGDYNTSMNFELDYVDYSGDPHKASRNFLHGLQEDGVYIDVYRFLNPYDLSYTWHVPGTPKRSRIDMAFASPSLISGIRDMSHYWYRKEISDHALISIKVDFEMIERGNGIFRCPTELHLDPSYQNIIESTVKKWLIDSQPESEEKMKLSKLADSLLNTHHNLALIRQDPGTEYFGVAEKVMMNNAQTICQQLPSTSRNGYRH